MKQQLIQILKCGASAATLILSGASLLAQPVVGESDLFTFTFNNEGTVNGQDRPIQAGNWDGMYSPSALPLATGPAVYADLSEGVTNELTPGAYKAGFLFVSGKNGQPAPGGFLVYSTNLNVVDELQWPQLAVTFANPQTDWYSEAPNGVSSLGELKVADLQALEMLVLPRNGDTVRFHFALKIAGEWYVSEQAFRHPDSSPSFGGWAVLNLPIQSANWLSGVVGASSLNLDFSANPPSVVATSELDPNAAVESVGIYIDTDDFTGQTDTWARVDSISLEVEYAPVLVAPAIESHPVGIGVTTGQGFSLEVAASGSEPLSYQWRKDGVAIEGATEATYSVGSAQLSDTGPYDCVVSNGAGEVISNVAVVNVTAAAQPPAVTEDPADATVNEGDDVVVSATVTGTGPLSYQWRKDGVDIEGATGASLTLEEIQLSDAGSYTVFVSNAQGSTESGAGTLMVNPVIAPTITQALAAVTVTEGEAVSLSVSASGTEPFSYQWRRNGVDIAGATEASLELTDTDPADSGSYDVVVSNYKGSVTSAAATVTVNPIIVAPAITMAPQSVAVTEGQPVELSGSASGTAPFTYQWRQDGVEIAGAVSATLSINAAGLSSAGDYDVVVSNASGSATSAAATVTVYPLPTVDPLLIQVDGRVQEVQITVTAVPQVSWTASEDADWLRIPSGFAGKGDGTVRLVILANDTGESRSATVLVGGREVMVLQGFLPQAEGFDAVVGSGTGNGGFFVSPWFGAYTYGTTDWIDHSELGWLYVGFAEDPANMYLYSLILDSWVWTNEDFFSVLYDFSRGGYVFYFIVEDAGVYLFDYATMSWSTL